MSGSTLVRTTMVGVRPLGVRGEPLHQAQAQIRGVIRRRLGDRHYHLLAEPQPHDLGGRIDWYTELSGPVRPVPALPDTELGPARADIDALLADIDRLGQTLEAGPTEDGRLAGKSLRLAAKRPSDDYLFLVGDQPVIVCWGYDTEAAGAVLPGAFLPSTSATAAVPAAPAPPVVPAATVPAAAAIAAPQARFPWLLWLLAGLLAILILLAASWLLRHWLPVPPDLRVTELPPESPPPAPPPPPDPTIALQRDLDGAREDDGKRGATLAALRDEFSKRYQLCRPPEPPPKPPEPPKPPPVVERKPPPPPPPAKPPDIPEDRWKKGDLALLKGCWRLGRDAQTNLRLPNGQVVQGYDRAGRICFGANGEGTREKSSEFPGQPTIRCQAPVTAAFQGDGTLRTTQPRVTCQPSQFFWTDRPNYLTCRRVSDSVALCRDNLGAEHEFRREGA
ncbi:hypothetical protein [Vineibacter terrae]|uniref:hypothetical protein n=1 Tax=Vineibacter terrae TaxID=2586908 RepID=UPI002E3194C6|nr:hypothetical protein [Vineibacter terrae]HEX2888680.1 hypothetical protein [Vineibacter terrae]